MTKSNFKLSTEYFFALTVIGALCWAMFFLATEGFLPQPFFYEPSDTYMDWFNTAYWAYDGGAYDYWKTIYPPLSFVFLKIFTNSMCYPETFYLASRDCDWSGIIVLHVIYLINIILIAVTFTKIDKKTALPRAIALAMGLPMLYALERGNLLLVTFTFLLLGYAPLLRHARLRWIAVGLAINFKVYLIASLFPQLLRRRWTWFEGGLMTTLLLYLVTFFIFGQGSPVDIIRNVQTVAGTFEAGSFLDGWYSSSYTPFMALLEGPYVPVNAILGSRLVDFLIILISTIKYSVLFVILAGVCAAWLRPEVVPMYRLTGIGIALALIMAESGGYTQMLVFLFVFMERWKGFAIGWAIVVSYILSIPGDIVVDSFLPSARESYLGGGIVFFEFKLILGSFIRPLLFMSIPFALSCLTIRQVWADIQQQGWQGRWRFRGDAPIMMGDGQAVQPVSRR